MAVPEAGAVEVAAVPTRDAEPMIERLLVRFTVPVGAMPALSAERETVNERELPATALAGVEDVRVVTAGTTVNGTGALVLALKLASPGKAAVRLSFPPGSATVCSSAMPSLARGAVPSVVVPLLKVMVPVAAPLGLAAVALLP